MNTRSLSAERDAVGGDMLMKFSLVVTLLIATACTPTIKVEAPSKPIEINLNVKIEHEIRIKVEKDLEDLFEDESDIF